MSAATRTMHRQDLNANSADRIHDRVEDIQSCWSPSERRRRREEGASRRERFLQMLISAATRNQ